MLRESDGAGASDYPGKGFLALQERRRPQVDAVQV
jgi:hypothetical protein